MRGEGYEAISVKPFADVCKADSVNERFSTSIGRKAMREKIKAAGRPAASTPKFLTSMWMHRGPPQPYHPALPELGAGTRRQARVLTPNITKNYESYCTAAEQLLSMP